MQLPISPPRIASSRVTVRPIPVMLRFVVPVEERKQNLIKPMEWESGATAETVRPQIDYEAERKIRDSPATTLEDR